LGHDVVEVLIVLGSIGFGLTRELDRFRRDDSFRRISLALPCVPANVVCAVDIHPAVPVGNGVFIDHGTGLVVGETAVIGDDVSILHEVRLGGTGKERGDRQSSAR